MGTYVFSTATNTETALKEAKLAISKMDGYKVSDVYKRQVWIKYTHAYTLLKGILVVLLFILVAYIFKMNTILWIFSNLASTLIVGVIVIFQPELRKVLEQLGQKKIMSALIPFDAGKEVKERFRCV